jgi:eukaryotic-like serine/threonine-protein kinase
MPLHACPSRTDLAGFNLGRLPEQALEEIAAHLEECNRCEVAVKELDHETDLMVTSLRGLAQPGGQAGARPASLSVPYRLGDYEVLSELGRGSMGIVYLARHTRLQRVVALKMLLGGEFARDEVRARFNLEAKAVARLQHPNIIQIFEVGEWRSAATSHTVPYFTLEYVEGGSLSARLAGEPQPSFRAASWLVTLARAVDYAHKQAIVHRDLKPANVLLTADGRLKICDFGVAKLLTASPGETLGGLLIGTPEYMAPEQANGEGRLAQPVSDVYALGGILYTMLTGRPAFQGASVFETLEQVRRQEPLAPRRLQPAIPRDLETICLKCLEKDPRRRYSTAAGLADDLERFLSGETLLTRPAGTMERGWKWARRRPAVALLSLAMAAVTVASFALIVWQWRRAESKALAEAAANAAAQWHRIKAIQSQAELALTQGLALCDRAEVGQGLLWLSRSMELAEGASLDNLDRATRINLADWSGQLVRTLWVAQHDAPILDLAFSPDGRTLVSVGKGRHIRAWDSQSGMPSGPPLVLHGLGDLEWIGRIAFDPRDSRTMVTGDFAGRAVFWDMARRAQSRPPLLHPPTHMIWGMTFTPDGRRLATSCDDGMVRWWDAATGQPFGKPRRHGKAQGYYTLALSPDGRELATGGKDMRILRWDVETMQQIGAPLYFNSPVHMIAFLNDSKRLVAGTRDGGLQVWDAEKSRMSELPSQGTSVTSLAVSSNGKTFATGTAGGVLRFWDTSCLGQTGATCELVVSVTGLAFHPDGRLLAVGQDDGTVRLLEIPEPKAIGPDLRIGSAVHTVLFSGDGKRLLTGSSKGAQWWELETGKPLGERMHCSRYEPAKKVRSADGRRTFDVVAMVEATTISPDATSLAIARWAGSEERVRGEAELWNAITGERLRQIPVQPFPLTGVVFSPDSSRLLTWDSRAQSAIIWDAATLQVGRPFLRSLDVPIRRAVFNSRGDLLLLACQDGTARLWDVARDEELPPPGGLRHGYPVTAAAFDLDGRRVATGCQGGIVCLWKLSRRTLLHDMRGNAGEVDAIAFSPDGNTLLTGSHDGTARFWDVESGRQLGPSLRHTDAVLSVAFHPDGRSVVTGTKNGTARRWRVPISPRQGSVPAIRTWVEAQTGLALDLQGAAHPCLAEPGPIVVPEQPSRVQPKTINDAVQAPPSR